MSKRKEIINLYDTVCKEYSEQFYNELSNKPFDRFILKRFADENKDKGLILDIGCGPGQTTKYLFDNGLTFIMGMDISPGIIAEARRLNPKLSFIVGDILNFKVESAVKVFSALAFYSIVHFDYSEIASLFAKVHTILDDQGQFLFSFHVGKENRVVNELLGHKVRAEFYFHEPEKIIELLEAANFNVVDAVVRAPYKNFEHPSHRAYIIVNKKGGN